MSQLGPILTNSISYWERNRLLYNAALTATVVYHAWWAWPASWSWLTASHAMLLFILAVVANIFYCAAYLVDVPVQLSEFRSSWLEKRSGLLLVGIPMGVILAHYAMAELVMGGAWL